MSDENNKLQDNAGTNYCTGLERETRPQNKPTSCESSKRPVFIGLTNMRYPTKSAVKPSRRFEIIGKRRGVRGPTIVRQASSVKPNCNEGEGAKNIPQKVNKQQCSVMTARAKQAAPETQYARCSTPHYVTCERTTSCGEPFATPA